MAAASAAGGSAAGLESTVLVVSMSALMDKTIRDNLNALLNERSDIKLAISAGLTRRISSSVFREIISDLKAHLNLQDYSESAETMEFQIGYQDRGYISLHHLKISSYGVDAGGRVPDPPRGVAAGCAVQYGLSADIEATARHFATAHGIDASKVTLCDLPETLSTFIADQCKPAPVQLPFAGAATTATAPESAASLG